MMNYSTGRKLSANTNKSLSPDSVDLVLYIKASKVKLTIT